MIFINKVGEEHVQLIYTSGVQSAINDKRYIDSEISPHSIDSLECTF